MLIGFNNILDIIKQGLLYSVVISYTGVTFQKWGINGESSVIRMALENPLYHR
jgi:hypothetical protein